MIEYNITKEVNKNKTIQQQPKVPNIETKTIPSPRIADGTFEEITETDLPIIGDISSPNTPQSHTSSRSKILDQEEAPSQGTTMKRGQISIVDTASKISACKTPATTTVESTRDESQISLLGERSPSTNEVAMEQEVNMTSDATIREDSQDSMAELRRIISTPIEVNEVQEEIDMYQHEKDTGEQEITITEILEEINKSSSTKSDNSILEDQSNKSRNNNTQHYEVESEINLVVDEQSTRDESQDSLLGEIITDPPSDTPTNQQEEVTTIGAAVQNINSSKPLIPMEEFTLIEDQDSLEEIVIYDMVVEYQGVAQYDEDMSGIRQKAYEKRTSEIILVNASQNPRVESKEDGLEADDEQWGRDSVHEDDMVLITKERSDPTPTNNDCISNIYGYEEVDNPTIPTAVFYRYCKPPTSLEEVQLRENFRERRLRYFASRANKVGHSWFPETYLPDPEDPEWSWKEGLELDLPAQSAYQLNED